MKKTIITLLALGGVAVAAEPPSYSITLGDAVTKSISEGSQKIWLDGAGGQFDKNFNDGWMMDFSITSYTLTEADSYTIFKAQGVDGGLEITVYADNTIALTDGNGTKSITTAITLDTDVVYRAAYDKEASKVYLSNTETYESVTGDWNSSLSQYANIGTYAATFYTNDKVTISVGNAYDMKGITGEDFKSYAIPEPTTATLSLLALAGLAARRRRK